jgi:hypothetical protein
VIQDHDTLESFADGKRRSLRLPPTVWAPLARNAVAVLPQAVSVQGSTILHAKKVTKSSGVVKDRLQRGAVLSDIPACNPEAPLADYEQ